MEASLMVDALVGVILFLGGWLVKRIFAQIDRLHTRVTDLATETVSRSELNTHIDRILDRIDALEQRLLNRE
tara:strand:- start:979 stop:1194 length:216 start_codon:yes stop_codon:yes gene_type:complete